MVASDKDAKPEVSANPLAALAKSEIAEDILTEIKVPQEIKDFVRAGHEFWRAMPKKWRKVRLADEKAVEWVITDARKYARSIGLTFRVQKHPDPLLLRYKVTDKIRANSDDQPERDDENG